MRIQKQIFLLFNLNGCIKCVFLRTIAKTATLWSRWKKVCIHCRVFLFLFCETYYVFATLETHSHFRRNISYTYQLLISAFGISIFTLFKQKVIQSLKMPQNRILLTIRETASLVLQQWHYVVFNTLPPFLPPTP